MKRVVKRILSWLLMKVVASDIENATLMDCKGRFIKPFNPECKEIDLDHCAITNHAIFWSNQIIRGTTLCQYGKNLHIY